MWAVLPILPLAGRVDTAVIPEPERLQQKE